jgi:ribosomal protein S18 acetylase RimI-like enzyme
MVKVRRPMEADWQLTALVGQDPERYDQTLDAVPRTFKTRDGRVLYVRLIRASDSPLLLEFFERLSSETRRRRFHVDADHVPEERKREIAQQLADVDNLTCGGAVLAIDVLEDGTEHIVGVGRLARPEGDDAVPVVEAALVIRDDFQGQGVGTELVFRMVLLAKQMQAQMISAVFQPNNDVAIRLFRRLNLPTKISASHGETTMTISVPLSQTFSS